MQPSAAMHHGSPKPGCTTACTSSRQCSPGFRLAGVPLAAPHRRLPHTVAPGQLLTPAPGATVACNALTAAAAASSAVLPIVHHRQEFHDHHQQQQRRQWRAAAAASACPSHSSRRGRARICSAVTCAAAGAALAIAPAATAAATASFSQVFAVALGYCVLVGSLFRGVPQIVKVVQARSVEGLSVTSNVVETLCYTVVVAYNISQGYAFNTFGEVFACWVQDILLVCLIARYSGLPLWQAVVSGTAFVGICFYLLFGCPLYVLAALQACTVVVMALGSRLPQIMLNIKRGNSGMLSVTSCALNVAGNTARIFTTCVLTGDVLLLTSSLTQGCLNSILLWQSVETEKRRQRGQLVIATGPAPA